MYIKRHLENLVRKTSKMFGAILVTGPRQVGKTTLLKKITQNIPYITLDDPIMLTSAREESGTFFKNTPPPVFVDEIQYAPNLFHHMKILIDKQQNEGLFYMSGSQQFKIMKNVSESLAGRLGILNLLGLSLREIYEVDFTEIFLPTENYFKRHEKSLKKIEYKDIWKIIHRGTMPKLYGNPDIDWQMFYGSYIKTYIERDVRDLAQVGDELKFLKFMTVVASHTGNLLNLSSISRDIGISLPTVERWLSILIASGIVYLLKPYFNNTTKRAVKTPKLYFLDTGLAAYLTKWNTPQTLQNGAMAGAFFETFIIAEIVKSYYNNGILELPFYFYRDKEKIEIDLIIENDGVFHPIEIKKNSDPRKEDIKNFDILDKIPNIRRGIGGIICTYDKLIALNSHDKIIPVMYL
ncbi:MAG: ATP-binding protein [Firmicutes bacterium]|nr:ATP-binding protein [Bacillota bacterium]